MPTLPSVDSFTATPDSIVSGETSTLAWTVTDATSVEIVDEADAVVYSGAEVDGTVDVTPTATTTYTLTATNADGSAEAAVTVTVGAPGLPTVDAFTAAPSTITSGGSSTLAWTVTDATSVVIVDEADAEVYSGSDLDGDVVVSPTTTTTYTLTATNADGSADADVTVTVGTATAATISDLTAEVVSGSQVALTWTAENAASFDIYAVHASDPDVLIEGGVSGAASGATVPIPASDRQTVKVIARSPVDDAEDTVALSNVVVSAEDYDPYDSLGFTPETAIPGTLRFLVGLAQAGDVIGFASDITEIELYGVDLINNGEGLVDAHLIVDADVTISGPAAGVTLRGIAGVEIGDPGVVDPFTYQSRVVYVPETANVVLENLVITGGTFIYKGAGIRVDGTLTLRDSTVTGNRAWDNGGGIYNKGTLAIEGSTISGNTSAVEDDEVNSTYDIRDIFTINITNGGFGGGLYNDGGTVTITDSVISDNVAKFSGGAVYNHAGTVTVIDSTIADNAADFSLYADNDPGLTPFSYGGGFLNLATLSVSGSEVSGNDARYNGGGLYADADGQSDLSDVQFGLNSADFGGAIYHEYYEGESANLGLTNVPNTGTNIARVEGPFIYEADLGPRPVAPTSFEPRPGLFRLLPGTDPVMHDR